MVGENRSIDVARTALEKYRRKLLDLGGRNRFLNFTHRETARTQIRLVNNSPQAIYDLLAAEKELSFNGIRKPAHLEPTEIPDLHDDDDLDGPAISRRTRAFDPEAVASAARAQGIDPSYELADTFENPSNAKLQSLLFDEPLKTRLQAIYEESKRSIQELGINTLSCSIGFLEWYEADSSDRARYAPLLIVPLEIKRALVSAKYEFHVSGLGEEPQNNPSLTERVVADFGIRLPTYQPEQTVADFFSVTEEAIKSLKRWKVRRMATISLLNFAKLALYRDLDVSLRPTHAPLESHPVVMDLLCGSEDSTSVLIDNDENIDAPAIANRVPLLVTEADSSQFAAIADAMAGKSMVIEGPPGTGKSQTITNIIAAAMANGERVLFVAEKLAALDVVKSKLDSYGLGTFCLELHSTKARKSDVHKSLDQRLRRTREREPERAALIADLNQQKSVIQSYLDSLHAISGNLGVRLHDLIWREQRMRLDLGDDAAILEDIVAPGARDYDEAGISAINHRLAGFESSWKDLCAAYGSPQRHPWYGIRSAELKLDARQALIKRLRLYQGALADLQTSVFGPMKAAEVQGSESIWGLIEFATLAESISGPGPKLPGHVLLALKSPEAAAIAERFMTNVAARDEMRSAQAPVVLDRLAEEYGNVVPVISELLSLGEKETALVNLKDRAQLLEMNCVELGNVRSHLRSLEALFQKLHENDILTSIDLAKLFKITSRRVILQRLESLIAEADAFDITSACTTGRQLQLERNDISAQFFLQDLPNSKALRAHARALRDAGPFWFLKSDARAARSVYKKCSRINTRFSNELILGFFENLSSHFERTEAFESSKRNSALFGELFNGLDTDFDFAEAVVEFGENVRRISRSATNASKIREVAFCSSPDEIDRFIHLINDPKTEIILKLTSPDWDASLQRKVIELQNCIRLLCELELKLRAFELNGALRLSDLTKIFEVGIKHRDLSLRILGDGAAKKLFEASFVELCENSEPLRAALEYFRAVDGTSISDATKIKLRSVSAEVRDELMAAIGATWRLRAQSFYEKFASLPDDKDIDNLRFFGAVDPFGKGIETVNERVTYALNAADRLEEWLGFEAAQQKAIDAAGVSLITAFETARLSANTSLPRAFEYCIIRTMVRLAIDEHPNLRGMAGVTLNDARRKFRELDIKVIELNRTYLASILDRVRVDPGNGVGPKRGYTGKALISNEAAKQTRHISVRDLVQRSGLALQQLKPCFMMSPLSVAQYIPAGSIEFDLVVIDEASQMRPEDSLAALSRGKRAIVVGDQKQLPPTSFFQRAIDEEDVPDEDAVDNESVLDLALGQYGHSRRLRWHYRSRHQSLIAFSNKYFYDDDLIVLPSPQDAKGELGVRSTFVESAYSRGGRNVGEAETLVEAVLRFMRSSIDCSVGVVAVNKEQRDFIQELLDRAIAEDGEAQRYVARWENTLYPFFVKNLESVQGDERDVMFISTVYGPETIGGPVAQRFGPILGRDGWRRLNVLFTRARMRVELFTSMRPGDIRTEEGRSQRGVLALRNYLEYARAGRLDVGELNARPPDSDFEISVGRMLEMHGYEVVPQVGVDKYYIDLAVRHPRHGGFALGIECDGATYHSSRSARDRDRTREEALAGLGWSLYRIWSTDWFANPAREFEKLNTRLKLLLSE